MANRFFGLTRYWYNKAIEYLRQEGTKAIVSEVRKIQKESHPDWAFQCPQRIREYAFSDACNAVKNAKRKYRQTGKLSKVKFRSRKDVTQRFGFDKQSLKENFIFSRKQFRWRFYASEKFKPIAEGTKVIRKNGKYFLIVPEFQHQYNPENQRLGVVALDPGVRTFLTFYSNKVIGKIGQGAMTPIYRLCYHLDRLYSKMTKVNAKRRRAMKKAAGRIRDRIQNMISDLHHKAAFFLVNNFDIILLPTFETSNMVSKLKSKVARGMLTLAHYRFKLFIKSKAEQYGALVLDVNESYTSKTCSYCGKVHNIGSNKVLKCCGQKLDRDLNGARGIFLRALGAPPSPELANSRVS